MSGRGVRRGIAAVAVVGVVGAGWAAYAANASDPSYRTAVATVDDVRETLALSGRLEPTDRSDLQVGTDGTVASVLVGEGDRVQAGQVVARLDRTALTTAVQRAQADLDAARAQLESDEDAQASTVSATTSVAAATLVVARTDPLGDLQDAVTAAQSAATAAIADAKTALAAQQAACDPTDESTTEDDCSAALLAVQAAQDTVATAQDALETALDQLAAYLATVQTPSEQPTEQPSQPPEQQSSQQPAQQPGQQLAQEAPAQETPDVSAATLARDQAAIDQARADRVTAQQALRAATVRAPHAGRVGALDVAVGDQVAAGDAVATVVAPGTTTVEVAVTSEQVRRLDVGQRASVRPAGAERSLKARVTAIGAVPDTSSGSTTYPVTITLARTDAALAAGATAAVDVVVGSASDVVTVPASAVRDGAVTVLDGDGSTTKSVTTGLVGSTRIEVTDGLSAGDVVVVADLSADVPTSDTGTDPTRPTGEIRFEGPGPVQMTK